jgi:hypothetical protein
MSDKDSERLAGILKQLDDPEDRDLVRYLAVKAEDRLAAIMLRLKDPQDRALIARLALHAGGPGQCPI